VKRGLSEGRYVFLVGHAVKIRYASPSDTGIDIQQEAMVGIPYDTFVVSQATID
jgi:hypothetical protein